MKKLGVIQESIGSFLLNMRTKNNREPKVYTYDNAKTMGILYDVVDKNTHLQVAEFAKLVQSLHGDIHVTMLGFLDNPDLQQALPQTVKTDFYGVEDFSWSGKLQKGSAYDFIGTKYDILLDITTQDSYPLLYVLMASVASYKVGRFVEEDMRYDLMIDTQEDNSISNLITQINVYLSKIKTK